MAEEATKLWSALSDWTRDHGAGPLHEVDDDLATSPVECTVCPLCRTVHAVRSLNPEVRAHLSTAVSSLAQAASAFLSTRPPAAEDTTAQDPAADRD